MATVFLNGVLASTALDANVAGGTTPDQIVSTGALDGGRIRGAENTDSLAFDLAGSNIANSVANGNAGNDALVFFNSFAAVRSSITDTNIFGGTFNDFIDFGFGVAGDDVVVGAGTKVRGNDGDDSIFVESADGALFNGNLGNDLIVIDGVNALYGFQNSEVFGGQGNDTVSISGATTSTIKGNAGNDSIDFAAGGAVGLLVNGNDGQDAITADSISGLISDTVVRGGADDDTLNFAAANTASVDLFGDAGDDIITGGAGADDITGGVGADLLTGGVGAVDNFIFEVGDSLAATAKGSDPAGNFVVYGNGVDVITDLEGGLVLDTVTYDGVSYDADDIGTVIGLATINTDGDFVAETVGSDSSLWVVQGAWNAIGGDFGVQVNPALNVDALFFDAGKALIAGDTVIGTSVEGLVIENVFA